MCASIAARMRQLGHVIPPKSEYEQAHVINLMLEYYEKFGSNWRDEIENYLRANSSGDQPAGQG